MACLSEPLNCVFGILRLHFFLLLKSLPSIFNLGLDCIQPLLFLVLLDLSALLEHFIFLLSFLYVMLRIPIVWLVGEGNIKIGPRV